MNRREFLQKSLLGAAAAAVAASPAKLFASETPQPPRGGRGPRREAPELKIAFQEGIAPGANLDEKLDYMEQLGVVGFEPNGKNLAGRINEIQQALRGRNVKISAICAGFGGFLLAEDPAVKKEFDTTYRDILAAAGELGAVGVIMVPAFTRQVPVKPHTPETRAYLVEQLQELGEFALKHGTTVILEPLNRREAFFLRQVADAASICRDTQCDGVRCMGDFWHMTHEETSDYGAFYSGGQYLNHVHIASRGNRKMPGEDGQLDNYVEGFRALKQMGYQGNVSFECGTNGDRKLTVPAAVKLIREQWERA